MQYRTLGKTGLKVSALGFGTMRLPCIDGVTANIDIPQATRLLRQAIDDGVNYVDTAYPYHDGFSEPAVAQVLRDGYRERVYLATKLPMWAIKCYDDFDRLLNKQLERLETNYIDIYLFHAVLGDNWNQMRELGAREWATRAKADGRIGAIGFSSHCDTAQFKATIDDYDWDLCQIQYNYMNENVQAGTEGLAYATERHLGVVIMEPLLGGGLAAPPDSIAAQIADDPRFSSPADMALRWLWNKREISVVLSGMNAEQQVVENLASASRSGIGTLSAEDVAFVERVRAAFDGLVPIPCTKCRYCMPCPNGLDIPYNFELYNMGSTQGDNHLALSRNLYAALSTEQRAESCIACGLCEAKCPQSIPISEWMPKVHELLLKH